MLPHPPPGPARRRLAALAIAALIALIAGIAVGAGGGTSGAKRAATVTKPPARAVKAAKQLSLERQIGELLMISFRGTSPPAYVRRALRLGRATG